MARRAARVRLRVGIGKMRTVYYYVTFIWSPAWLGDMKLAIFELRVPGG